MKRQIVSITLILCLLLCFSGVPVHAVDTTDFSNPYVDSSWIDFAAPAFAGGDGTEHNPYLIESAEQLALLAKQVNNLNDAYTHAHYLLTSDIDLGGRQWTPIGAIADNETAFLGFNGVFNGNGHTISNMTITEDDPSLYQFGLFGWSLGTIQNIVLKDALIQFDSPREGWQASNGMGSSISIGGICGSSVFDDSLVENCLVENIEIDVSVAMSVSVGGAIGDLNYSSAKYISTSGRINVKANRALWVGGCIGDIANCTTTEQSCFFGSISTESNGDVGDGTHGYVHYVGGFTGDAGRANNDITIKNCYSEAEIFSKQETGKQDVGGFAGALGTIHHYASYENLVTKSTITTDRAGVISSEQSFWQGEIGFGRQPNTFQYKNCVVITDDEIIVTNRSSTQSRDTKHYSLSESSVKQILIDELGFHDEIWKISDHGDITLTMPHNYTAVVTEPTCTEGGYTTYTCACGESYVDDYTDALGHDLGKWMVVTAPTCTDSGTERSVCSRCDYYEERVMEATGHRYTGVVTAPTCTEQGYTTYTCACGESYISDYTDALGHDYVDGICTRCGEEDPDYEKPVENPFTDVPAGSFYEAPVLWAVENGITNGASADSFNPNGQCQRAHVVTFLWRAAGQPEPTSTENPFVDVQASDFYYKAVLWAVEKGITNGLDATHFGSFEYCNRAQVVTFLYRAMGSPAVSTAECPFTDVAPGAWYEAPILWAVENGVTNGVGNGLFGVNTVCNRAQVVTFLYRAFN